MFQPLVWNGLGFKQMEKTVYEFIGYIQNNAHLICNYGERYRAGQIISTAIIESLVNSLASKRFVKKQQMQWTQEGAHLLMQTRAMVINGELRGHFRRWYPDFPEDSLEQAA